MMGSACVDTLKRKVSTVECPKMKEGEKYEVKIVGATRDRKQHVQLKERSVNNATNFLRLCYIRLFVC